MLFVNCKRFASSGGAGHCVLAVDLLSGDLEEAHDTVRVH